MPNRTRTPRVTIDLVMPAQQSLRRSASGSLRAPPSRSGVANVGHSKSGSSSVVCGPGSPPGGGCRPSVLPSGVCRSDSPTRCRAGSPACGATCRVEDAAVARRKAIEAQLAAATGAVAEARQMLNHQPMRAATYDNVGDSVLEESLARMVSSIEASLDLASNCAGKIHKQGGTAARSSPASGRCLPRRPKPVVTDSGTAFGGDQVTRHAGVVRTARPGGLKVAPPSPFGTRRSGRHSPPGKGGMSARLVQSVTGEV